MRHRGRDRARDESDDHRRARACGEAITTSCLTSRPTIPAARSWGTDPKTSVVNRYLQSWDADNLFIMGASTFPQQPAYNPTGPVGALAYWSAEAIVTKYLKSPGPLVHA